MGEGMPKDKKMSGGKKQKGKKKMKKGKM